MQILMKIMICLFVKLQPLSCKCSLDHVAFHLMILFENSAIPWFVVCLADVNVDKVKKNYVCSRKRNFHMRFSPLWLVTLLLHVRYANLHVVTQ